MSDSMAMTHHYLYKMNTALATATMSLRIDQLVIINSPIGEWRIGAALDIGTCQDATAEIKTLFDAGESDNRPMSGLCQQYTKQFLEEVKYDI